MNREAAALISLLSECNPKDEELLRESRAQKILSSEEYAVLQHRKAFSNLCDTYLSREKLSQYSEDQLTGISETLPLIPDFLDNLLFSLRNGPAPTLTTDDAPDFFDKRKIEALSDKLGESTGKNYTNIGSDDFMAIFDPNTVKSIRADFEKLPYETADIGQDIENLLGSTKYCISENEINVLQEEYDKKVSELQGILASSQKAKRRRRYFKTFVGIGLIFIPSIFAVATGALSGAALGMCSLIQLVLVILYWIWG